MEKRHDIRHGGKLVVQVTDGIIHLDDKILTKNEAVAISCSLLEAYHAACKFSPPTVKRIG